MILNTLTVAQFSITWGFRLLSRASDTYQNPVMIDPDELSLSTRPTTNHAGNPIQPP